MLGNEFSPSLQISRLRLIEGHCFIYAHFSPEHEFHFVLDERSELAGVRFEPDVVLLVRASHPVREPMVEFAGRFLCPRWVSVSREDRILFGVGNAARSVVVGYTRQRCVHLAGGQFGIGYRAEAAGLVDVDLAAMLRRGDARCQQECQGDQHVRRRRFDHWR